MIDGGRFLGFLLLTIAMVVVPGPSVLFTISRALTVGKRDALITVIGNTIGVYLQVVCVAFGLGAIVATSAAVFTVIKFLGAGYLVYLGVQAIRHRHRMTDAFRDAVPVATVHGLKRIRDGFFVGFANPKSIVFLAAVLPQFVLVEAGPAWSQILILGLALPLVALISDSVWALVAGTARDWFARSPRRLRAIGGAGGLTMIGLGITIAVTGRKD